MLGPDMSLLSSHSQPHTQHAQSHMHQQSHPHTQSHVQSQSHTHSAPSSSHMPTSYGIGSRSRNGNEPPGGGDDAAVSVSQNEITCTRDLGLALLYYSLLVSPLFFTSSTFIAILLTCITSVCPLQYIVHYIFLSSAHS